MLSLRVIPRSIVNQFKKPSAQQLEKSIKLLYSKDSSSSSSSDSDSDKEDKKIKKQEDKKFSKDSRKPSDLSNTNKRLDAVLQQFTQESIKSKQNSKTGESKVSPKTVNVAIKPKRDRFIELQKEKPKKKKPFEQQLVEAAKDVAKSMKGDPKKTELELLSKVLDLEKPSLIEETTPTEDAPEKANLSNLLSNMRVDSTIKPSSNQTDSFDKRRKDLGDKFKKRFQEPSIASSLLHKRSTRTPRRPQKPEVELKVHHEPLGIFKNVIEQVQVTSQLNTWKAMEEREIKLATLSAPQNAFQELIQWTNEGKIWKFPIDNEQGMEEEAKIHFSEHIFMERHLKNWCPRRGPIRHFMELVCVGLSKNPYMTVEEKVGHITWYRDYFEDKKDLLNELELLDKTLDESKDKKQIEA